MVGKRITAGYWKGDCRERVHMLKLQLSFLLKLNLFSIYEQLLLSSKFVIGNPFNS